MAVVGYQYRVDGGTPIDVGNVLEILVSELDPDTTYLFEVRAYDAALNYSDWSSVTEDTPIPTDPQIVGHGDSMMWGSGDESTDPATENPSIQTRDLLGAPWIHTNVAYPGASLGHPSAASPDDLLDGGLVTVDPLYDPFALHNILIINGGINNVPFVPGPVVMGTTYPYVLARLKTFYIQYGLARRAAGWCRGLGPIVSPLPVSDFPNTPSDFESFLRGPFNDWLASDFYRFAAEYADWTGNANIGDGANTANATYFDVSDPDSGGATDRLHLTAAGYAIEATYFEDAIERMVDDVTAPAVPTALSVTALNCEQVEVDYTNSAGDNVHHYEIKLNGGAFTDEVIDIGRENPYVIKNLEGATLYSVQMRTVDVGRTRSAWTTADSDTTDAGDFTRLRAIDCGRTTGGLVSGWEQDVDFTGVTAAYSFTSPLPTTFLVEDPAPTAVYNKARINGGFPNTITYTLADVDPAFHHRVRIHLIDGNVTHNAVPTVGTWAMDLEVNTVSIRTALDLSIETGVGNTVIIVEAQIAAGATDIEIVATDNGGTSQITAIELFGVPYTPPPPPPVSNKIDIGRATGGEVSTWTDEAENTDVSVSGGTTFVHSTGTVSTAGETDPAPEAVYRNVRYELGAGAITVVWSGLTPSTSYNFRTHHWSHSGELSGTCTMKCTANGVEEFNQAMDFTTNGVYIQSFASTSDGAGEITFVFEKVTTGAIVSGIELMP